MKNEYTRKATVAICDGARDASKICRCNGISEMSQSARVRETRGQERDNVLIASARTREMRKAKEKSMKSKAVSGVGRDILNSIPNFPNTITGADLAYACGLTSSAMVRRQVNALRSAGFPIVSTQDGYSVATNAKQI